MDLLDFWAQGISAAQRQFDRAMRQDWLSASAGGLGDLGTAMDNAGSLMGLSRADKNQIEYSLSGIPVIGDVLHARDSFNRINDYLQNTGQDWSSIQYPSLVMGADSLGGALRSGYSFVSKNIDKLYS